MPRQIDLNCDMGESFGAWTMGQDEAVMPLVSTANIACGFHAGDPMVMRDTVKLAKRHGVAIGAHVSLPDLLGFGRREMRVSAEEVYAYTLAQIGALAAFVDTEGVALHHVKPHGALYNMAARDAALAEAVAQAVRDFDPDLVLYGLAGSELVRVGRALGMAVAREAFCDRRYEPDGKLTPRREPGAVIEEPGVAADQVLALVLHGELRTRAGSPLKIEADTICVHGDRADAAEFVRVLRTRLVQAGVDIRAFDPGVAA